MQKEAFRFYLPLFETTFLERIALRLIRRKMRSKKRWTAFVCLHIPYWMPQLKRKVQDSLRNEYSLHGYMLSVLPTEHFELFLVIFGTNCGQRELRAIWIDELLAYHNRMKDASGVL